MSNLAIMLPVFAQIALTFGVAIKTFTSRAAALKAREVSFKDIALDSNAWSNNVKKASNNFNNQFQVPILFYAVVGFSIVLGKVDLVAVILSWVFVASRYVHSFIHIRANNVIKRFYAFAAGVFAVLLLWLWLAVRLYLIG